MINLKHSPGPYEGREAEEITERLLESSGLYVALEHLARGDMDWMTFCGTIEILMENAHIRMCEDRKEAAELAMSEAEGA